MKFVQIALNSISFVTITSLSRCRIGPKISLRLWPSVLHPDFLPGLFVFDPVELSWNDISNKTSGIAPSLRCDFGFASAAGKLFVHGGYNPLGNVLSLTQLARTSLLLALFKLSPSLLVRHPHKNGVAFSMILMLSFLIYCSWRSGRLVFFWSCNNVMGKNLGNRKGPVTTVATKSRIYILWRASVPFWRKEWSRSQKQPSPEKLSFLW